MFLLDSLLIDGLGWVFDKVRVVADTEMDDEAGLREALLHAQTRLEAGEIGETEYTALERDVLDRLSAVRRRRLEDRDTAAEYRVTGADVVVTGDDDGRD